MSSNVGDFYAGENQSGNFNKAADGEFDDMIDDIIEQIDDSISDIPCVCNRGDCENPPSKELTDRFKQLKPLFKKLAEGQQQS